MTRDQNLPVRPSPRFYPHSENLGGLPPSWIATMGLVPIVRCPTYGVAEKYASCISVDVPFCMDTEIPQEGITGQNSQQAEGVAI